MLDSSILKNYSFSQAEFRILKKIIEVARQAKIHLILWTPTVHPVLKKEWARLGVDRDFRNVQTWLQQERLNYIDLNPSNRKSEQQRLRCRLWADSSHLSDVCSADVFRVIQSLAIEHRNP